MTELTVSRVDRFGFDSLFRKPIADPLIDFVADSSRYGYGCLAILFKEADPASREDRGSQVVAAQPLLPACFARLRGRTHCDPLERARVRSAALSLAGRDIGTLPEVVNPEWKEQAMGDFQLFCESNFPQTFYLPWSTDHLKVIAKIEQAVLHGGLFAMAMPRGSGKTSQVESACLWAILYGHRDFVCLIGSDERLGRHERRFLMGAHLMQQRKVDVVIPLGRGSRCGRAVSE